MSLTKITWEEFDTFEKIESPKGYDFRTHEGKYYTFGEFGERHVKLILKRRTIVGHQRKKREENLEENL